MKISVTVLSALFLANVGGINAVNAITLSNEAFMNAIPEVTYIVQGRKDEACEQAAFMKKQKSTAPRFLQNRQAWVQLCQRRTGILNILVSGGKDQKVDTIKRIVSDRQVKEVVEMEEARIQAEQEMGFDYSSNPLDGPL